MKNKQTGSASIFIIVAVVLIGLGIYMYLPTYNEMVVNKSRADSYREYEKTNATTTKTEIKTKIDIAFKISGNTLNVVQDGKITQTLSLDKDTSDIVAFEKIMADRIFITDQDVNFDGHADVAVLTGSGYGGVNDFYDYYIFNTTTNKLEKNAVLVQIGNPRIDTANKTVISTYRSGPQWYGQNFQWNGSTFIKSAEKPKIE